MSRLQIKPQIENSLKSHPFVPPIFMGNIYAQIAAFLFTPSFVCPVPKMERKLIKLPDGSKLVATCWFQTKKHAPTVVILNGIEGYTGNGTARFGPGVGYKAYNSGYNVIFLRQRGEGEGLPFTNSIGDFHCEDLPVALAEINTWGSSHIYVLGLSLGGWVALLSLGKIKDDLPTYIKGLIAVSAPTSTQETWSHVEKHAYFNNLLLKKYKGLVKRRIVIDPPGTWDMREFKNIHTKRQFFETYKHAFGYPERFKTIDEYLLSTDVLPYLKTIALPTLIIHAKDDPVIPVTPFLRPEVQNNPHIITLLSDKGSHGCFITGKKIDGDLDRHWAQNRVIEFIRLLEEQY